MAGMGLKDWLDAKGEKQDDFAERTGISQGTISRVCNGGDCKPATMRTIYKATDGEVTPNWIVLQQAG